MSDEQTISYPPSLVNPNHDCQYCQMKNDLLQQAKSDLKFRPKSLQQQILLEIGYRTYGREVDGNLPLPPSFIEKIKGIHQELDRWRYGIWNLRDVVNRHQRWRWFITRAIQEPRQIYCFYDQVHWTRELKIDRPATAHMILECLQSYANPDQINAFLLAVVNCQEIHIHHFWSQREVNNGGWSHGITTTYDRYGNERPVNPLLSYWLLKLKGRPNYLVAEALNSMNDYPSLHPISGDEWLNALQFMWPEIIEGVMMEIWLRKAVSSAIEGKCLQVASFVWDHVPINRQFHMVYLDDYKLWKKVMENGHFGIFAGNWDSIGSKSRCLELEEVAEPFYLAVKEEYRQIVDDTWNVMTDQLRNTVLKQYPDIFSLAVAKCFQMAIDCWNAMDSAHRTWILDNQPKCFYKAAIFGNLDMVTAMWEHASEVQRFQLVFEDSCASFRISCANGYVDIVRLLWQWASLDQRLHMLAQTHGEALSWAFRNGRMQVVQFLWQNMHSDAIVKAIEGSYVNEKALSDFICNSGDQKDIENFLGELYEHGRNSGASLALKSVFLNALVRKEEAALKILLERAEKTGNWVGITALLRVFDAKQKIWLRTKMNDHQAEKCGLAVMENSGVPTEENVEVEDKDEEGDNLDQTVTI